MSRSATPANEDCLLMIAKHGTAAHVKTVVRGYRRTKADRELKQANSRHQRRELYWYFDDDMVVVKVRLTPEDGAHIIKAIERAMKELQAHLNDFGNDTGAETGSSEETAPRSRRAEALLHAIAGPTDTEVQVHVSAEKIVTTMAAKIFEASSHLPRGRHFFASTSAKKSSLRR